jgi:tetratricopeptide (TPR) repeat protein
LRSNLTGDDGKALLALSNETAENDWVSLQILHSPAGKDLVMVSPWDYRALVPSFKNKSENFVPVVVVQRGDRAALENSTVVVALAAKLNKTNTSTPVALDRETLNRKVELDALAHEYGLTPDDVDGAIRALGARTTDPYQAGLAALYQRKYPQASANLRASLLQRESKLAADQKAVADAAFFLGASLLEQGKYRDAAAAYQKCLSLRPDDPVVLNDTALSLESGGDYISAEPFYRQSLAIRENELGPDHPDVANSLNNLALLMQDKGEYAEADELFRRALKIRESKLGPDHPDVATSLNNLALLLKKEGDYTQAERLYRRALAIKEKQLGPNHRRLVPTLSNLALLLEEKGNYVEAGRLYHRALAIQEKELGPDHPGLGAILNNLAGLLKAEGDYAEAERLYRRALAIEEKDLGPDHPFTRCIQLKLARIQENSSRQR